MVHMVIQAVGNEGKASNKQTPDTKTRSNKNKTTGNQFLLDEGGSGVIWSDWGALGVVGVGGKGFRVVIGGFCLFGVGLTWDGFTCVLF